MDKRKLGKANLDVPALGFGCGAVGGLMVRGTAAEQERAVARAIDLGIDYFDTAAAYGGGASERNLGRALAALRRDVTVGTKIWLPSGPEAGPPEDLVQAIDAAVDRSLGRLEIDRIDLLQLHNPISDQHRAGVIDWRTAIDVVAPAFEGLRAKGKIRFFGFSALGDTAAIRRVLGTGRFETVQVIYNALNPSAGAPRSPGAEAQDFSNLLSLARETSTGVIGIRVLAGGALSGNAARHPHGLPTVEPMGTGVDYLADVRQAMRLMPLVREGHVSSLIEAAFRFAISNPALATALIGFSSLDQVEHAAAAAEKGTLPPATLARIEELLAP